MSVLPSVICPSVGAVPQKLFNGKNNIWQVVDDITKEDTKLSVKNMHDNVLNVVNTVIKAETCNTFNMKNTEWMLRKKIIHHHHLWLYNPGWVLACSTVSFHSLLFLDLSFQFLTRSIRKLSSIWSLNLALGLPLFRVPTAVFGEIFNFGVPFRRSFQGGQATLIR